MAVEERDHPVVEQIGCRDRRLAIVELGAGDLGATTLSSNSRSVQRARPFGGLEQATAISLASFSPSKMRATAGVARCLRLNTISNPSSTSSTAIIERYRRRASSVEVSLIEMYLAGISVRRVADITAALCGTPVSPSTVSYLYKKIYA